MAETVRQSPGSLFPNDLARQSDVTSAVQVEANARISAVSGCQPLDSDLTAIAALATTTFGRSLLTLADAAAARTAIGVGSGTGTVTSVGLSLPAGFTVTNSPVTGSGTLTATTALSGILQASGGAFSVITVGSGLNFSASTLTATPAIVAPTSVGTVTLSTAFQPRASGPCSMNILCTINSVVSLGVAVSVQISATSGGTFLEVGSTNLITLLGVFTVAKEVITLPDLPAGYWVKGCRHWWNTYRHIGHLE